MFARYTPRRTARFNAASFPPVAVYHTMPTMSNAVVGRAHANALSCSEMPSQATRHVQRQLDMNAAVPSSPAPHRGENGDAPLKAPAGG